MDNNLKFDIINNKSSKNEKKLILKFYNYNTQRIYDKKREEDSSLIHRKLKFKNSTAQTFYRNNNKDNIFFNTCTDFSKKKIINRNNVKIFEINRPSSLDSSSRMGKIINDKKENINNKILKINESNYKSKLNGIKKRMTSLIDNLINYIKILKEEK